MSQQEVFQPRVSLRRSPQHSWADEVEGETQSSLPKPSNVDDSLNNSGNNALNNSGNNALPDVQQIVSGFSEQSGIIYEYLQTSRESSNRKGAMVDALTEIQKLFNLLASKYYKLDAMATAGRLEASLEQTVKSAILSLKQEIQTVSRQTSTSFKPQSLQTYSSVAATTSHPRDAIRSVQKPIKSARFTYVVEPKKGETALENGEQTKKALLGCLNPSQLKIQCDGIRKFGKNAVKLQTMSDLEKIDTKALEKAGLTIKPLSKFAPRLALRRVPVNMDKDQVKAAIISQNLEDADLQARAAKQITPLFKFGPRGGSNVNWVIQVTPELRNILLAQTRIYVGWEACTVSDHIRVTRCYQCQGFGHLAIHCKNDTQCGYCEGKHNSKNCENKAKPDMHRCVNCIKIGIKQDKAKHSTDSRECSAYRRKLDETISNIDYGN